MEFASFDKREEIEHNGDVLVEMAIIRICDTECSCGVFIHCDHTVAPNLTIDEEIQQV